MKRLINSCWSCFRWAVALVVLAALTVGGYLYFRLDEEIRRYAEQKLASQYPRLDVSVGGARFVPGRGVTVFDVILAERPGVGARGMSGPILRVAELTLVGRFEVRQFLNDDPIVDRIVVRRPRLAATRSPDGRWSCSRLLPLPESGARAPPLEIVDATLVIDDQTKPTSQALVLRNGDLSIERAAAADTPGAGRVVRFEGAAVDSIAKQIKIDGRVNLDTGAVELTASADNLRITNELLAAAPGAPVEALRGVRLQAHASVRLAASTAGKDSPWRWSSSFTVRNGTIGHTTLPRPITGLNLSGSCDPSGLTLRSCACKYGAAEITAACNRTGWAAAAPLAVRTRVAGLPIDEKLRGVLPPPAQRLWDRFRPTGVADIAATATFDGAAWRPDVTIDCRDLAVEDAEKFPYRATGGRGQLRFVDRGDAERGRLTLQIAAQAEGRPVSFSGEFRGIAVGASPPTKPTGWFQLDGPRLRVSDAMYAALEPHPKARRVFEALSPTGEFGLRFRMEKAPDQPRPDVSIDLVAKDCAIRYDRFPYPLEHIQGRLSGRNGEWAFTDFASRLPNDPRVVTASGSVKPVDGRMVFRIRLNAVAAPLDESLRQALPPEHQQLWSQLRPRGRVSFTTNVAYAVGDAKPSIEIDLTPHQRSVSIKPTFFQYELDRIDGRFLMTDGRVRFTGGRAEHGRTAYAANGGWTPGAGGAWRFELENLHVDYLDADHDLRLAAPLALRRIIDGLQPKGGFGVDNGRLAFTHNPSDPAGLRADWNVELDCHQASFTLGVPVEGVSGAIRIAGFSHGKNNQAYGQLKLDTLFWNGLQVTGVAGPFWADETECLVGRGVAEKIANAPAVEATATAYGGAASMNARALFGAQTQYFLAIGARGVDLNRFSRDYLNQATPVSGRVAGQVTLQGSGVSVQTLEGAGALQLSDANLYELPQMVAMLKALSGRVPDTTAFDGGQAEFTIQGKHLQFSRLDLIGDAVSFYGRGEASLEKKIDLTFHTIVGRNTPSVPFLRTLVGQASEQILRLRVLGTLDKPDFRRETLPVVGNMLEQLRADLKPQPLTQPAVAPRAAALRRQTR